MINELEHLTNVTFSFYTGVLWQYNNLIKDSNTVINRLVELGKKVRLIQFN